MQMKLDTEVLFIGGGPTALSVVCRSVFENEKFRKKFKVVEPSGFWMEKWKQQFAAQEIEYLRSPVVYHPHRRDEALFEYAESAGALEELISPGELFYKKYIESGQITISAFSKMFHRPSTSLFEDFCEHIVEENDLNDVILANKVFAVTPVSNEEGKYYKIDFESGPSMNVRAVVLSFGGGKPNIPEWAQEMKQDESILHSSEIDLRDYNQLHGKSILIVGSGLSAGHLAVGAWKRGAKVTLVSRGRLKEKQYDVAPLKVLSDGKKLLTKFSENRITLEERYQQIQIQREGGSMTPEVLSRIQEAVYRNELTVLENTFVTSVKKVNSTWKVTLNNKEIESNAIWLCTGTKMDFLGETILEKVLEQFPTQIYQGIPLLDENLRIPGSEIYVTGRYAAYRVGPEASNLGGSLVAARMVVDSLLNVCGLESDAHRANFRRKNKNKDQKAGLLRKK